MTATTATSARVAVVVPVDATVSAASFARLTGAGRFLGIILERAGDPNAFRAETIRYPEVDGSAPTMTSIILAAEDARDPDPIEQLNGETGRSCTTDCRLPAGTYELLFIADKAPLRVELTLGGLDGVLALDEEDLAPLRVRQSVTDPKRVPWQGIASSGGGWNFSSTAGPDPAAMVYSQAITDVIADAVGRFQAEYCRTVDDVCSGSSDTHVMVANTVDGRATKISYRREELGAGSHGLEASYNYERIGAGSHEIRHNALFIYR